MTSLRVPFPFKVLVSYLVVVFAGGLPILIYLERRFSVEVTEYAARSLALRAQRVARSISPLPPDGRVVQLQLLADNSMERYTLINDSGFVLYDSRVADLRSLENHRERLEVKAALGRLEGERPEFDPGIADTGVAQRVSATTGEDTLYAAALVPPAGERGPPSVIRVSIPVNEVQGLREALRTVFRNSLSLSISVAIFMSLLSAVFFLRPLQRVVVTANALAEGDYTASPPPLGNDEVGDVGRALKQLGIELRRRLAHAEASSAMMRQLVETVSVPLAVFDPDGEPVAINGPARELIGAAGAAEEDHLDAFASSEAVRAAKRRCLETGRPESIKLALPPDGAEIRGWISTLERPERPPFTVFMGRTAYRPAGSRLPKPSSVRVALLADVVAAGITRATAPLAADGIRPAQVGDVPKAWVADAYGRLTLALSIAVEESARLAAKTGDSGRLEVLVTDATAAVMLPGPLGSECVANLRMMIEPLGGEVRTESARTELHFARA